MLRVVCRPLPHNHVNPIENPVRFYSPGGRLLKTSPPFLQGNTSFTLHNQQRLMIPLLTAAWILGLTPKAWKTSNTIRLACCIALAEASSLKLKGLHSRGSWKARAGPFSLTDAGSWQHACSAWTCSVHPYIIGLHRQLCPSRELLHKYKQKAHSSAPLLRGKRRSPVSKERNTMQSMWISVTHTNTHSSADLHICCGV